MEIKDTPQDNSPSYHGESKILYATRDGHYQATPSSGWETETYATLQAVTALAEACRAAHQAVVRGEKSPLYYWMYRYRHDASSLAPAAGVWQWQLRRHCRADVFARLPEKTLRKYADALQMPLSQLCQLPSEPQP